MKHVEQHPHYPVTQESPHVPHRRMIHYHTIIQMPRSWLFDGRERQAREAVAVLERLLAEPPAVIRGESESPHPCSTSAAPHSG